jgi:hypothetical protein
MMNCPLKKLDKNIKFDNKQLGIGTRIEMEHTNSKMCAEKIAKQHLSEYSNYYKELPKFEKSLKKR